MGRIGFIAHSEAPASLVRKLSTQPRSVVSTRAPKDIADCEYEQRITYNKVRTDSRIQGGHCLRGKESKSHGKRSRQVSIRAYRMSFLYCTSIAITTPTRTVYLVRTFARVRDQSDGRETPRKHQLSSSIDLAAGNNSLPEKLI